MKKSNLILAAATPLFVMFFTACQGPNDTSNKTETLTYQFSVNGCDTGKKSFSDLPSYCQGLLDDHANNYCAQNMRHEMHSKKCMDVTSKKQDSQDTEQTSSTTDDDSMVETQVEPVEMPNQEVQDTLFDEPNLATNQKALIE